MTHEWLSVAVALLPPVGLWAAYPRRPAAASAIFAAALAAGAALLVSAPEAGRAGAALTAAWGIAGSALSWRLARRRETEQSGLVERLASVRVQRERMAEELRGLKARGLNAELAHREATALYGMVKSLSEAMSWEEARPRVEGALEQYFGPRVEYALYVAGLRGEGEVRPLAVRGLRASPGAAWATLERLMQEQGATAASPRAFEKPERSVGVPIKEGQELLGYLYARVPEGADASAWLAKTQSFVSELGVAFRRVKLFQEVERLSEIDGLTGVRRRGAFDKKIAEELVRAKTFKTTFGLMLLDIDHFKSLNDRYGHPFGDQVLKRIGVVLNSLVYDTDFVARYGGEEFAIVLPRAEPAGALRKAEAIRAAIEAELFSVGFEELRVTISIGVSHFPRDASTPEELIARADAALYSAKAGGRNRVVDSDALRRTN
ncbi:MAG: GGDEF domain-containing protein [Elusimicrobia bacterium]|nr:GGDEF domain-containing protein [Elusimicrobiota bacterium]